MYQEKKKYEKPQSEIVIFETEDIITTSGETGSGGSQDPIAELTDL